MTLVRIARVQNPKSGLARDITVNQLFFVIGGNDLGDPDAGVLNAVFGLLDTCWNTAVVGGTALRAFMAESTMATQRVTYVAYNMAHPTPRAPLLTTQAANPTPAIAGAAYPSEVALCASFRGEKQSGQSGGRARGRIFLGPLVSNMSTADGAGHHRPSADATFSVANAFARLARDAAALSVPATWVVFSPTSHSPGANPVLATTPVKHVWCDNAFDTQRRRGVAPSTRVAVNV